MIDAFRKEFIHPKIGAIPDPATCFPPTVKPAKARICKKKTPKAKGAPKEKGPPKGTKKSLEVIHSAQNKVCRLHCYNKLMV